MIDLTIMMGLVFLNVALAIVNYALYVVKSKQ